ncbi:MAG: hypothetical protein V5B39_20410 [Accumulibacter sp.]|jgi:hypothetical protein|uniref:hypothetical protein n=1 Tax=Accumulibacter sp. TaxID=2053492 RepID=UPI002FC378BB
MNPSTTPSTGFDPPRSPPDFSLVLGGPLFQLLRGARLEDDAATLVGRRIAAFVLLTWVPLLVAAAVEGLAWDGRVAVPFLRDAAVHARFLAALPLLVVAELVVHLRIRGVVAQFLEREIIAGAEIARFDGAIQSAMRLRNSVTAEVLMIALVYGLAISGIWRQTIGLDAATWYSPVVGPGAEFSAAGWWLAYVSLPLFQFLLLRWYFRLFVWARFLWQVSRLDLRLLPTHSDGVAGLAFLGNVSHAMAPLAAAHGAMVAGVLADAIFHTGVKLTDFSVEVFMVVALMLCLVVGPLLVFAPRLAAAKRAGNRAYGALAQRLAREFDTKWQRGGAPAGQPFVSSPDISALADYTNALNVVRTMQIVPFTRQALLQLAVATLLPIAPLLLTIMPLEQLLKLLLGVVV